MVKWVKYMLLLHMFAAYITFRPLPCASLRELHASFLSELRSQSWFLPLVSEDSPWLIAKAFVGAEATNTTNTTAPDDESSASSNSISIGAFVLLLGLGLTISGILLVCLCDCTCVQLCKGARRRLQVLKHDGALSTVRKQAHLANVPAYLKPETQGATDEVAAVASSSRARLGRAGAKARTFFKG